MPRAWHSFGTALTPAGSWPSCFGRSPLAPTSSSSGSPGAEFRSLNRWQRPSEAELDVFVARKVGVPGYRELAMGAVASGEATVANDGVLRELDISHEMFQDAAGPPRSGPR